MVVITISFISTAMSRFVGYVVAVDVVMDRTLVPIAFYKIDTSRLVCEGGGNWINLIGDHGCNQDE